MAATGDPSLRSVEDVCTDLGVDPARGLDEGEAARRLAADGPNELRQTAPTPRWRRFLQHFRDPLVGLLLGAVAISVAAWLVEGRHGWPVDALVIAAIVLVNAVLGFAQEARAATAVAALARWTAATSTVLRGGRPRRVPDRELVCGDVLVLAEGDAIGADARLVAASDLRLQEASLTGESETVRKDPATLPAPAALADRLDMVWKGTAVARGTGRAVVTATGMDTEIGRIAALLEATPEPPTPLQKEVARIGRVLGLAVLLIAAIVVAAIVLLAQPRSASDFLTVMLFGVSLAVAAVPEGLPAILSVVLALGVQRMAKRNAIVKRLSSVETLGAATVICSDKTGTLTRSEMTIQRVATASGRVRVTGVGYAPEGRVLHDGEPVEGGPLHAELVVVLSGGTLASNADLRQRPDGAWEVLGDPTEAAFLVAERKLGASRRRADRFERIAEIAFSSERKRMSTIERDRERGGELVLVTKGAPEVLLPLCSHLRVGADVVPFDDAARARAIADVERFSGAALRTLAVAYRPLAADESPEQGAALERDLVFVGTVGIIDPPREEVGAAIREAQRAGIRVIMITGDHPRTAARIAADLAITAPDEQALSGAEIDALDDAAFAAAVRTRSVFARVAPAHKLRIVAALQAQGHVVAMTGDGVNDAPALEAADIGVAMGVTGTEVTKEAAEMILADDDFATIVHAVREGRAIFDDIRKFLRYLLSSNTGEVITVFLGVVGAGVIGLGDGDDGAFVLPLLATQILWINLLTDAGPALAMGIDPPADDLMARPPRRPGEHAIDARTWRRIAETGLVMALATLATLDLHLPGGLFDGDGDLGTARTAGFTVLVFAQLFNCFDARSETTSAFHRPFTNGWLWAAIGLSLLLQVAVVHLGFLQVAFGTVPLDLGQWLACAAMGSSVLWFGELRKLARRALRAGDRR